MACCSALVHVRTAALHCAHMRMHSCRTNASLGLPRGLLRVPNETKTTRGVRKHACAAQDHGTTSTWGIQVPVAPLLHAILSVPGCVGAMCSDLRSDGIKTIRVGTVDVYTKDDLGNSKSAGSGVIGIPGMIERIIHRPRYRGGGGRAHRDSPPCPTFSFFPPSSIWAAHQMGI